LQRGAAEFFCCSKQAGKIKEGTHSGYSGDNALAFRANAHPNLRCNGVVSRETRMRPAAPVAAQRLVGQLISRVRSSSISLARFDRNRDS
jgi:hypothetical protein